jgi:succinyl-CoA synthetase beta subunit
MNIHEYQAKQILRQYNIPTSTGIIILQEEHIDDLIDDMEAEIYVVKAQIHSGGRGKAGGVKVVRNKHDAKQIAHDMFNKVLVTVQTGPIGQKVRRLYIESGCDIAKEYYFSVVFDRSTSRIVLIASTEGGVDIEDVAHNNPDKLIKISIDPIAGIQQFHCRQIAFGLELKGDQAKEMIRIVGASYKAFVENDMNQMEINPLIITKEGKLLALDAKINFDDNGLYKHQDIQAMRDEDEEDHLEIRASKSGLSYVKMDGNIGCMVNGAGLAMATMDIIKFYGAEPANFLDVGGGADREKVAEAFKIILSDTSVKGILVNIFGGIMRCNIIAEGIIAAANDVHLHVPLVVRLAGTNFELGKTILANSGLKIIVADDLADAANKIVEAIK